ncbi:MAG: hypothetical protein V3V25_03975 [Paracoccaceae bacterium]
MKRIFIILVLAIGGLGGCASAGFLGQPMQPITVAGSTFNVYMRSGTSQVEAHRVSFEMLPSLVITLTNAHRAIEVATGCRVESGSLQGEQAIIKARVDCLLP